ncbi:cell death activator CIDE-A [Pelobates cultripes]|uniref:Cell death activator CIDE-A n=1 Tax=Pelobates cultripes TaxID=61616 RepID=A0AAD1RZU3_PELCU|nr:cell death activator CIDE-A [Pelobates cultripes]
MDAREEYFGLGSMCIAISRIISHTHNVSSAETYSSDKCTGETAHFHFLQILERHHIYKYISNNKADLQEDVRGRSITSSSQLEKKKGVANIILDVYKLNPKDFIGCLNIKATFYEKYSVAFDIQCLGAKKFLRKFCQLLSHLAQITGHLLLYSSSVMMQWSECPDEETPHKRERTGI